MIKEKNLLLKLKLEKKKSPILEFYNKNLESFYALYDLLLANPIENFWYECLNILLGYLQLISYLFDSNVSSILLIFIIKNK